MDSFNVFLDYVYHVNRINLIKNRYGVFEKITYSYSPLNYKHFYSTEIQGEYLIKTFTMPGLLNINNNNIEAFHVLHYYMTFGLSSEQYKFIQDRNKLSIKVHIDKNREVDPKYINKKLIEMEKAEVSLNVSSIEMYHVYGNWKHLKDSDQIVFYLEEQLSLFDIVPEINETMKTLNNGIVNSDGQNSIQ